MVMINMYNLLHASLQPHQQCESEDCVNLDSWFLAHSGKKVGVLRIFLLNSCCQWDSAGRCYYFHWVSEKDILDKGWLVWRLTTMTDRTAARTQICWHFLLQRSSFTTKYSGYNTAKVTCLTPIVWDPERLSP